LNSFNSKLPRKEVPLDNSPCNLSESSSNRNCIANKEVQTSTLVLSTSDLLLNKMRNFHRSGMLKTGSKSVDKSKEPYETTVQASQNESNQMVRAKNKFGPSVDHPTFYKKKLEEELLENEQKTPIKARDTPIHFTQAKAEYKSKMNGSAQDERSKLTMQTRTSKRNNQERFYSFYDRMEKYENKRKRNREAILRIERSKANVIFMHKRSKELTKNIPGFLKRNHYSTTHKSSNNSYSFQPIITSYAQKVKKKTLQEMSYKSLNMKRHRMEIRKEELLKDEYSACTFKPTLYKSNKFSKVQSKLSLNMSLNSYIEKLRNEKNKKRKVKISCDIDRELKEAIDCIHK